MVANRELFGERPRTVGYEDVMKAYFTNLPVRVWLLVTLSVLVVAYPVVTMVVPAVVRAVVPETVRTVLSLL
jgi:hypothetical protein